MSGEDPDTEVIGMHVVCSLAADVAGSLKLKAASWPGDAEAVHRREIIKWLAAGEGAAEVFVARIISGHAVGQPEAALRRNHVNGYDTTLVASLEGRRC